MKEGRKESQNHLLTSHIEKAKSTPCLLLSMNAHRHMGVSFSSAWQLAVLLRLAFIAARWPHFPLKEGRPSCNLDSAVTWQPCHKVTELVLEKKKRERESKEHLHAQAVGLNSRPLEC